MGLIKTTLKIAKYCIAGYVLFQAGSYVYRTYNEFKDSPNPLAFSAVEVVDDTENSLSNIASTLNKSIIGDAWNDLRQAKNAHKQKSHESIDNKVE